MTEFSPSEGKLVRTVFGRGLWTLSCSGSLVKYSIISQQAFYLNSSFTTCCSATFVLDVCVCVRLCEHAPVTECFPLKTDGMWEELCPEDFRPLYSFCVWLWAKTGGPWLNTDTEQNRRPVTNQDFVGWFAQAGTTGTPSATWWQKPQSPP